MQEENLTQPEVNRAEENVYTPEIQKARNLKKGSPAFYFNSIHC